MIRIRPRYKAFNSITVICLVAVISMLAMAGCRDVAGPSPAARSEAPGGQVDLAEACFLSVDDGPLLTVTNEYMDPVEWPYLGSIVYIPDAVPLEFCWTAKRAKDGGEIAAYRYGWDVLDLEDPEAWDTDFIPWNGSRVCSPTKTFNAWGVHMFAVEVIDDAGASSRVLIAIEIKMGPVSYDVMPGTCKNPFNVNRKGQLRTVLPGRIGLEVSEYDLSSLELWVDGNTVMPLGTRVKDITSPMINRQPCDCPPNEADGIDDLLIIFATEDIVRAMGHVGEGDTREIWIRGELLDGSDFSLKDCVEIVGLPRTGEEPALFQRDAVLATLQNAYDARNINLIDGILDDEFVFFFSERDYMQGRVPFPQWGREDEFAATANMFSSQPPAGALTSVSLNDRLRHVGASEEITWGIIKNLFFSGAAGGDTDVFLLLVYNKGEDNWVSMLSPDPVRYPDEVWYQKTANYFLMVTTGGYTYQAILVQAEFTVRYSEPKGGWQLVQWRDDI